MICRSPEWLTTLRWCRWTWHSRIANGWAYEVASPTNVPIPDPSIVTAQEIEKAARQLRAESEAKIDALRQIIETRFDAKDKADVVLSENVNRVPTLLDREISTVRGHTEQRFIGLRQWIEEKFAGLERLQDERIGGLKTAFREDKIAASTAVNAALAAQKEAALAQNMSNTAAIAKAEASTMKALESLDDKISGLKESFGSELGNLTGRIDRGEGGFQGVRSQINEQRENTTLYIAITGGIVGFLVLIVAIAALWISTQHAAGRGDQSGAIAVAPLNPSALAAPSK